MALGGISCGGGLIGPFRALCVYAVGRGMLWAVSRVGSSPSGVYPAGKFKWHFTCGFDFRHGL